MEFVPPNAPIVVLAFLGTLFLLGLLALASVVAFAAKRPPVARWGLGAAAIVAAAYAGVLLTASAVSRERILGPGGMKYFCEIDCHLAYSVQGIQITSEIGSPPGTLRAAGRFYVVALRTWFDEHTISARRGREKPLYPNPRVVYVEDAAGRRYERSPAAEEALVAMGGHSTPLTDPLRPGEYYVTLLVFDLPRDAGTPRFFVGNDPALEFALIGHEMSPLHRKIWFAMR